MSSALDDVLDDQARPRSESDEADQSRGWGIATEPVIQVFVIMSVVSYAGWALSGPGYPYHQGFALRPPLLDPWYSPLLATFAHLNLTHFLKNVLLIGICGGLISFAGTSQIRFHAFFVITGVVTSVGHVIIQDLAGNMVGVIGSSGAGFALLGYILVTNPITLPVLRSIGTRAAVIVGAVVSISLSLQLSSEGSAVLAHFIGLVLGMIAGRFRLLAVR